MTSDERINHVLDAIEVSSRSDLACDMGNLLRQIRQMRGHIPRNGSFDRDVSAMFTVVRREAMSMLSDYDLACGFEPTTERK